MNTHSSLDPESLQSLLASAFAVQESGIDPQSLSILMELQRSIAKDEREVAQAMQRIADGARMVANASGAAIALIKADQLIYRAGSGSAASYVGRHVTAVLSVSARNEPRSEILRVENAQTDSRIEAAICQQFGAMSLLILPIYRERVLSGVLQILFGEPHAFDDREIRTYRLMASAVEKLILREGEIELARKAAPPIKLPMNPRQTPSAAPALARTGVAKVAGAQIPTHLLLGGLRWKLASAAFVLTMVMSSAVLYKHWRSAPNAASVPAGIHTSEQQMPSAPATSGVLVNASQVENIAGVQGNRKSLSPAFKRVVAGPAEVDYVADDVTIRHFTSATPERFASRQVNFGKDVTVRYFAYSSPKVRPVSAAAEPVEHTLPVSK
ncbi:MAG TPA: GAF domain-containing protein [Candidatus Sulfotelmatobacter sp.]|nr:GAF domain-containing protein [Candidatus Sulfotelmatobacter sp.]